MLTENNRAVELAERVEALLAELDERVEVYAAEQGTNAVAVELALAWVAGRHDLSEGTVTQLRELRRRRREAARTRPSIPRDDWGGEP